MLDENNISEYIKSSNLITQELKNNLIEHFDKLSQNQIRVLINHFNNQKNEILKVLITLKDKNICSFEEIKTNLDKVNRDIIKKQEAKDKQEDEKTILDLLDEIY